MKDLTQLTSKDSSKEVKISEKQILHHSTTDSSGVTVDVELLASILRPSSKLWGVLKEDLRPGRIATTHESHMVDCTGGSSTLHNAK